MTPALSRRTVLKAGAALGGGLLLELPATAGAATSASRASFTPNAFVRITPDDVVQFAVARVDMGQGTTTMHAQLIAEELGIQPSAMSIVLVGADHAYDDPKAGIQMTGGSASTRGAWEQYRRAGAVAREMLVSAAAERWGIRRDQLTVRDGAVHHPASGRSLRFGALAADAATMPIPRVSLKQSGFTVVGQSVPRLDSAMKVNGTAVYGMDVQRPGGLVAVLLRCPVPGGTLKAFDDTRARALDGVAHVVRVPSGLAVVGKTTWHARRGAEAVQVEWDEGPLKDFDSKGLRAEHARLLAAPGGQKVFERGELEQAWARPGLTVVEAEYALPYLAHATMEPQNATAVVKDGRCEVWAPTQGPGVAVEALSKALDLPGSAIQVHQTWVGGGFGRRGIMDYVLEAAHTSKAIGGLPVKVVWTREDDMRHSPYRPAATHRVKGAVDGQGRIVAWHQRIATQSVLVPIVGEFAGALIPGAPRFLKNALAGAATRFMADKDPTAFEGANTLPYAVDALRVDFLRHEPGVPVLFWRSVGHSHVAFATESFMDELAHAAKADPLAFRLERLGAEPRQRAVLELAARKAGWGSPLPAGVGRGLALHHSFETTAAAVAEVRVVDGAVKVERVVMAVDCGRAVNPDIVKSQLESAAVFGLSATLHGAITFEKGRVQQSNFHDYQPLRLDECPVIETHLVDSTEAPTGIGEPGVPVIAPAVANAVFALTGQRLRELPLKLPA